MSTCPECHALVNSEESGLHADWHDRQAEIINRIYRIPEEA